MIELFFLAAAIITFYMILKWLIRLFMIKIVINSVFKGIEKQIKNMKGMFKNGESRTESEGKS